MKLDTTAIIMAGGKSTRMGFDKQELRIGEQRLMHIQIQRLRELFDEIIIVSNRPELYSGMNEIVVSDIYKEMGPLGGIHAGLKRSSSRFSYIIACDMPYLNIDYIAYMRSLLSEECSDSAVITLKGKWIEPFNAFYGKDMINSIEELLDANKRCINDLFEMSQVNYILEEKAREFSPDWSMFANLNTRQDLEDLIADHAAGGAS